MNKWWIAGWALLGMLGGHHGPRDRRRPGPLKDWRNRAVPGPRREHAVVIVMG